MKTSRFIISCHSEPRVCFIQHCILLAREHFLHFFINERQSPLTKNLALKGKRKLKELVKDNSQIPAPNVSKMPLSKFIFQSQIYSSGDICKITSVQYG